MQITSDRSYRFDCTPDAFWLAVGRTDSFQGWWPWLKAFRADGFTEGSSWQCVVRPPLPYVVRFDLYFETVEQPTTIGVRISGDIDGRAGIDIAPTPGGCDVRLRSRLAPRNRFLQMVARVAQPIVVFGHDWVLDTGARQFQQHAVPGVLLTPPQKPAGPAVSS